VKSRTVIAGVGNVFLGDDAFGVEVARLLAERPMPANTEVHDFGIRGLHLAYELLDGCDLFILVDAAPRGEQPGTVTVLEVGYAEPESEPGRPEPESEPESGPDPVPVPVMDAHGLAPDEVFRLLDSLGGRPGRSLVVACEPADVSPGMGLSDPVRAALPHAVQAVEEILRKGMCE
jgi:hydrogenase maturation protease